MHAPAKVNLALRVGGRRADGYHELDTLFQAVDLHDELEVSRGGEGIELVVEGEDAGPVADNLVMGAARAFLVAAGPVAEGAGLHVRLHKRIPAGAGLGGGSSDAAATLRALDRLFPGAVDSTRLKELAASLGSDVPFFLGASPLARGRGRGERLEPSNPLPPVTGLVMMPPVTMQTARAYAILDRRRELTAEAAPSGGLNVPESWEAVARDAVNDFEEAVAEDLDEVGRALGALRATGSLISLLAGSGSACFALYRSEKEAEDAANVVGRALPCRLFRVRTLTAWPDVTIR